MKYILYCDESSKDGKHFGNFYGGALVQENKLQSIEIALNAKKQELNLNGEIKWTKVTDNYLLKYIELTDLFFEYIRSGDVKIRIMFTQAMRVPVGLTKNQKENEFSLLYYQFFKHAFGFQYAGHPMSIRVMFDTLPDKKEVNAKFKSYISKIDTLPDFKNAGISIPLNQIAEVLSHDHVVLQCMDVILGSMYFRLNDLHKEIPEGSKRRGKRTVAKEALYKRINNNIQTIYPHFNIGASTGTKVLSDRWNHPYRHWLFKPVSAVVDASKSKSYTKK